MKKFLPLLAVLVFTIPATMAQAGAPLTPVDHDHICMITDKAFESKQVPVIIGEATYYGCCPMCKEKLESSSQARTAIDPVSKRPIDKAKAVTGAAPDGSVFYFESETNLKKYRP